MVRTKKESASQENSEVTPNKSQQHKKEWSSQAIVNSVMTELKKVFKENDRWISELKTEIVKLKSKQIKLVTTINEHAIKYFNKMKR